MEKYYHVSYTVTTMDGDVLRNGSQFEFNASGKKLALREYDYIKKHEDNPRISIITFDETGKKHEKDVTADFDAAYNYETETWNDDKVREAAEKAISARFGSSAILVWEA